MKVNFARGGLASLLVVTLLSALSACEDPTDRLVRRLYAEHNRDTCDGPDPVRYRIAEQLGESGDSRAVPALSDVLISEDEGVLTSGAAGCVPKSGQTYPAAIRSLAKFGPAASAATPRLLQLLDDPRTPKGIVLGDLTAPILSALQQIEPAKAAELTVNAFGRHLSLPATLPIYLVELRKFEAGLSAQKSSLTPLLRRIDPAALSPADRREFLSVLLYSGAYAEDPARVREILSDAQVLRAVDVRAFTGTAETLLSEVIRVLESFDQLFGDPALDVGSWCGPKNPEGARNALRGQLFSILIAMCTRDSIAFLDRYERERGITVKCGQSSKSCRMTLGPV